VLGLPAVGVVLMAALLILPGAAARFWTDRLGRMLALSAAFGLLVGAVGTALSAQYSGLPAGPIIVLVGTAVFIVSVLLAPRRGGVARLLASAALRRKIQEQKLLRTIYERRDSRRGAEDTIGLNDLLTNKAWSAAQVRSRLAALAADDLVQPTGSDRYRLTPAGIERASHVARTHALWRLFLEQNPELSGSLVDLDIDTLDEQLSPEVIRGLEAKLAQEAVS
jgi:manganese/zinc/iron transport system permease protein